MTILTCGNLTNQDLSTVRCWVEAGAPRCEKDSHRPNYPPPTTPTLRKAFTHDRMGKKM